MAKRRIDLSDVVGAAADLADRSGPRNISMGDVAAHLGVAPSALYNHVGGLDELQHHLAVHATGQLARRLRDAVVAVSGPQAIAAIAHAYRDFSTDRPGLFAASLSPPEDVADDLAAAHRRVVDVFVNVARSLGLDDDRALHVARLLRSTVHGFVALESIDAFVTPVDRDDTFEQLIELALIAPVA